MTIALLFGIAMFAITSTILLFYATVPAAYDKYGQIRRQQAAQAMISLEEMYVWITRHKIELVFGLSPVVMGIVLFILFGQKILLVIGFVLGFVMPQLAIVQMQRRRKSKFHAQLIDVLISLSQSLKAGLSLLQAFEVVVEEMPAPASQEFALLIKENKMGVPLEESFERLNKKTQLEDLNLMATAILVARETGGNLTSTFEHLSENIRRKTRINDQVKTLTIQGRLQAVIMSILPVVFAVVVYQLDPHTFDVMLESEKGRLLLIWAAFSEIIGVMFLKRLSRVEV